MILVKNNEVKKQYSELSLKQRLFEKESIVSIEIKTNFYPIIIDSLVIYGSIDITVDTDIKSLKDMENKKYSEGKVVVNLNEDGKWNTYTLYDFKLKFKKIKNNEISFLLEMDEIKIDTSANITCLYTIGNKDIKDYFDMNDFYFKPVEKPLSSKVVYKFYTNNN